MVKTPTQILESIREYAQAAGFEISGIAPVSGNGFDELRYFPEWIERGHAGEMEYLKSRNEQGELKRAVLRNVAPWARSVVVCAINYNAAKPYSTEMNDASRGWISRYAWFGNTENNKATDYHDAVLARLRRAEAELYKHALEFSDEP